MNSLLSSPPPPHQLFDPRYMTSMSLPSTSSSSSSRKRKADDDNARPEDRMSASPSLSPNLTSQSLPTISSAAPPRSIKRIKSGTVGRPLNLSRLLETLDADALRHVLRTVCEAHPQLAAEVERGTPRPSVTAALDVLRGYEARLVAAFPFGGNPGSDYAYNRVRPALGALLDALSDYTPHFLPPNEPQTSVSLAFLDGATDFIHRLPNWDSYQNSLVKLNAYDELSRAWCLVLREAAKRAGGIQLQYEGWDKKLAKHNQQAGGRLDAAVQELNTILGWMGAQGAPSGNRSTRSDDVQAVRQELLSGTYGANLGVRVGSW